MEKSFLIFLAHGSRRKASNDEIELIFSEINKLIFKDYASKQVAFLELAEPSLSNVLDKIGIESSHKNIDEKDKKINVDVFPYFLAEGNHIAKDIPGILSEKEKLYPNITINLLDYFGRTKGLSSFIAKSINQLS